MGKYDSFVRRQRPKPAQGPHPIWRGIGCLLLVIVPVISFGLALITFESALARQWPIPDEFLGNPDLPNFLYRSQALIPLLTAITSVTNLYGYLAFTLVYMIILGGTLSFLYAVLYRMVGPPTYGPMDMPPPRGIRVKRYKR